jgi:valyl-tRNA synthetase
VGNGSSGTRRFDKLRTIKENENYIKTFCKSSEVSYEAPKNKDNLIKSSVDNIEIYVAVEELVDFGFEVKRIGSEIKKVKLELEKSENKINNPEFISKAPAKVVEKELNKVKELKGRLNFLDEELNKINKSIKRASKIP